MGNGNNLVGRLLERGLRAKDLYSLYRSFCLKLRYGAQVHFASIALGMERGSVVLLEKASSIHFGRFVYVRKGTDIEVYGSAAIHIGDNVFINKNCTIVARTGISIGAHCLLGEDVSIYDHNHRHSEPGIPFHEQGFNCKSVTIGNNVWIGAKVFIGSGVTIGDNSIIGAGAILTKDVPSNTVAFNRMTTEMRAMHNE